MTGKVTDGVTDESTGGDRCDGCEDKTSSLLNVETQLAQVEQYTTGLEKELGEKENLAQNPSYAERYPLGPASPKQAQTIDNDRLQVNSYESKNPSQSVTKEENKGLKVGDKVIYVGKKYRESIGNQVMEVVKISVHWTGNQVTCKYNKGWTTWIPEGYLQKIRV